MHMFSLFDIGCCLRAELYREKDLIERGAYFKFLLDKGGGGLLERRA